MRGGETSRNTGDSRGKTGVPGDNRVRGLKLSRDGGLEKLIIDNQPTPYDCADED